MAEIICIYQVSSNYDPIGLPGASGDGSGMRDSDANGTAFGSEFLSGQWIKAVLPEIALVSYVDILPIGSSAPGGWGPTYTNGLALQYSLDDATWNTFNTTNGSVENTWKQYTVNVPARYIRIYNSGLGYVAVGSFRIFGDPLSNVNNYASGLI